MNMEYSALIFDDCTDAEDSFERVDFHVAKLVIARRTALFFAYYS